MIIGIDTRIPLKNKTGIGYLLSNLIPQLVKLSKDINFKILGEDLGIKEENVKVFYLRGIKRKLFNYLWKKFNFPSANILLGRADKFFFTNFVDFPIRTNERILLIPDLSFIKHPQFTEKKNLEFLRKNVALSIKRADKIITISESAKHDIVEHYKIESDKVYVVYLAPSKNIKKIDNEDAINRIKRKYRIRKKYILFVGTLEPRKNIKNLIRAYNELDFKLKKEYQLVIGGGKGWYWKEILETVKKLRLTKKVIFTNYIKEEDLSYIYSGAEVFVFPSFYEGFGLPILEAMKCGIPAVSSNTSSLPEVGGEAVLYFDPHSVDDIKDNLERVLKDENLRRDLVEKGFEQVKKFSWEKAAREVLGILLK